MFWQDGKCQRVGKVVCLLWKEIILLFKACTPQWQWCWWRNIWGVQQSPKQLKKNRRWEEMLKRRIPWKWQPRHILLWLICHPLSPYLLQFTQWVKHSPFLSSLFTLMPPFPVLHHHFSHGCAIVLTEAACHDSLLTHFILHAGRIFQQKYCNSIICLVIETVLHVYKGQFCPWLEQFIMCIHQIQLSFSHIKSSAWPPDFIGFAVSKLSNFTHNLTSSSAYIINFQDQSSPGKDYIKFILCILNIHTLGCVEYIGI